MLQRPSRKSAASQQIYSLNSSSVETISVSSTVLSTEDARMDGICEKTLINPIPSPPIAARSSHEKLQTMRLRHAVSFAAFFDLSDTDLWLNSTSNLSLYNPNVDSSFVQPPAAEEEIKQLEGKPRKVRRMVLLYNRALDRLRRMLKGPRPDKPSMT